MKNQIKFEDVNDKIICIRNQNVILDSDVAMLYGVPTREINRAVKNNPNKFPNWYVFALQEAEKQYAVENFHRFENLKRSSVTPKVFTEKGLYMLATILKGAQAEQTTIEIVEAFAKLRELQNHLLNLNTVDNIEVVKPEIIEKTGGLLNTLLFPKFPVSSAATSVEVNLGVVKMKHEFKHDNPNIMSQNESFQAQFNELKQMILDMQKQQSKI
jgi:phage regulator Rha-like protein